MVEEKAETRLSPLFFSNLDQQYALQSDHCINDTVAWLRTSGGVDETLASHLKGRVNILK